MPETKDFPALDRLSAHLDAHAGRMAEADTPLAVDALKEFLLSGAAMGRGLREVTARLRPADPVGASAAYLFVITVDAATHDGRDHVLGTYADSPQPLAEAARELHAILVSDDFRKAVGRRPIQGGDRGCRPT